MRPTKKKKKNKSERERTKNNKRYKYIIITSRRLAKSVGRDFVRKSHYYYYFARFPEGRRRIVNRTESPAEVRIFFYYYTIIVF